MPAAVRFRNDGFPDFDMRNSAASAALAAATFFATIAPSFAAQLRVEPVTLEITAPAGAGVLNLRNDDKSEMVAQTRVFRWTQNDGVERLEPATDVVASPPAVKLAPGGDYVVRVVRTARTAVLDEEAYRVIVDQLPDARRQGQRAVSLLIRQSIPVFFRAPQVVAASVEWTWRLDGNKVVAVAVNRGEERLRIASLRLRDASGTTVSFGNGLNGYVLGRSSMSFVGPVYPRGFAASGGPVAISAESNRGPIHAMAPPAPRR